MEGDNSRPTSGDLDEQALFFHRHPKPGKLAIQATKPLGNQRDLALAYSPGVAAPCLAIAKAPNLAADYTSRANLVAVVASRILTATPILRLLLGDPFHEGDKVHPFMNCFDHAFLSAVDHFQRLRLICANGNNQAATYSKLLKQRFGHFWRCSRY